MGVKKYLLSPIYGYAWLRSFHHAAAFGTPVWLMRHFAPHVGRVNKFLHHLHASMCGVGLLTL